MTTNTSQQDKIFIEKYVGKDMKEPVTVEIAADNQKTGVFVGNCTGPNCTIVIKGKMKNLTVSGCKDVAIVFDDCITTVEVIGSTKVAIQANNSAGSYIVDKSDRTTLYLAAESYKQKVVLMSCMSTSTNVVTPTPDGEDQVENSVPDQIQSNFVAGQPPTHAVVIPDAE